MPELTLRVLLRSNWPERSKFDYATAYSNIQAERPGMRVFQVLSKTGAGMDNLPGVLAAPLAELRAAATV